MTPPFADDALDLELAHQPGGALLAHLDAAREAKRACSRGAL
jgi:hypothetical protein